MHDSTIKSSDFQHLRQPPVKAKTIIGDESFLAIEELKIAGPLLTADVTGSIESAPRFADALLNLQVQVEAQSDVQFALASAGVRFDKEGSARVRISGIRATRSRGSRAPIARGFILCTHVRVAVVL